MPRTRSTCRSSWSCRPARRRSPRRSGSAPRPSTGSRTSCTSAASRRRSGTRAASRPICPRARRRSRRPRGGGAGRAPRAASRSRSTRRRPSSARAAGYRLPGEGLDLDADGLIGFWEELCDRYPIVSIEDGLAEDDWDGWKALTERLGRRGAARRRRPLRHQRRPPPSGHRAGVANAILVKVNQIGTLTETLEAIELARANGYAAVMSHRSGETEDTTIADLAVATGRGADQDRGAVAERPRREVQPAPADRGGAGRRGGLPRLVRLPARRPLGGLGGMPPDCISPSLLSGRSGPRAR